VSFGSPAQERAMSTYDRQPEPPSPQAADAEAATHERAMAAYREIARKHEAALRALADR